MVDTTQSGRKMYYRRYYENRAALKKAQEVALPSNYVDVSPLPRGRPKKRSNGLRITHLEKPINPFGTCDLVATEGVWVLPSTSAGRSGLS